MRYTVKAHSGVYSGEIQENGTVLFKGVQFASCKRWQRPVVVPASDREIDAVEFGPASDKGDPDCLNAVMYLDPRSTCTKKAVFMWQYGSAQIGGNNANYSFANFVEKNPDIIVVCPNHRGHFFGSINLSSLHGYEEKKALYEASQNLARLDLLACLKWIRENIGAFGGDPERVTIGGHSSGSNNCTCLMLMEEAHTYFRQAACQASFCADTSLQYPDTADIVSQELFKYLKITTLDEALNTPAEAINAALSVFFERAMKGEAPFDNIEYKLFSPVIDNVVLFEDSFVKLRDGGMSGKTLMIGNNSGEYDAQYERFLKDTETYPTRESAAKAALGFTIGQNFGKLSDRGWNKEHADEVIRAYYRHNTEYGRDDFTAAMDLKNDLMLRCDSILYANAMSRYADVYMYLNDFGIDSLNGKRISHGSENDLIARNFEKVPDDMRDGAELISDLWAAFIRSGDPNCKALENAAKKTEEAAGGNGTGSCSHAGKNGRVWEKYTENEPNTLYIADKPRLEKGIRMKDLEILMPLLREWSILKE